MAISIHSARVGGDPLTRRGSPGFQFQSTPPVWAETAKETIFSSLKHLYYNIFYRKKQENSMQILSFGIFIPIFPFDFGANLPIC